MEILAQAVGEGIALEATQFWYPPCLGGPSCHPHEDGMISSILQPRNLSHIDISESQAWPGSPERQCLPVSTLRPLPLWIWNQSRPPPTLHFVFKERPRPASKASLMVCPDSKRHRPCGLKHGTGSDLDIILSLPFPGVTLGELLLGAMCAGRQLGSAEACPRLEWEGLLLPSLLLLLCLVACPLGSA